MDVIYYLRETVSPEPGWTDPAVITAAASMVIALCALFYSGFQTWQNHRHNVRMVKPHIQARYYYSQELGRFFYVLENYGLGPAIFQRVESEIGVLRPKINDDSVIWLVQQMVEGELGGYDDRDVRYDTVTKDCALPVGGTLNLFSFNCTEEEANRFRNTFLDTSKTTVHYKSAYGQKDCFLMTSDAYPYA